MDSSRQQVSETILVLCHSFFHDAFQLRRPVSVSDFNTWMSSRFVANLIIEINSERPISNPFAVTSQPCFQGFYDKFYAEHPSESTRLFLSILHDAIEVIDGPSINALSDNDSIFVICDKLYSYSNYSPILVSSIPSKKDKATTFYIKKGEIIDIPYPIKNVEETELTLRAQFPVQTAFVDKRMSESGI